MKKLTKQDRRLIAKIAKSLPVMVNPDNKVKLVVYGQSLHNHNIHVTKDGKEINPRKKYLTGEQPAEVNHRKELEKMFLQYGDIGLATYQKQILEKSLEQAAK